MESIDGEMDHNNYYRPCDHHSGVFCLLYICEDQTEDAYSKTASIRSKNTMDLALCQQPNMVRLKTLKDLVAFDALVIPV